mgnify:CR=1 FL=1
MAGFIAAVDVDYDDDRASCRAAAVVFVDWGDDQPHATRVVEIEGVEPYVSGEFFRRELPAVLPLIGRLRLDFALSAVLVDGFVDLADGKAGLGRHLYEALAGHVPIIGVAKNPFVGAPAEPVLRGSSKRPIWVSATGDTASAAGHVGRMHGAYRIPSMLRLVDRLARDR